MARSIIFVNDSGSPWNLMRFGGIVVPATGIYNATEVVTDDELINAIQKGLGAEFDSTHYLRINGVDKTAAESQGYGSPDQPGGYPTLNSSTNITDGQHGSRGGGSLHTVAVAGVSPGFLGADDKTKLDATGVLTSTAPVNVTKATADKGVSIEASRQDHKHDITTAAAVELTDSTNAEGGATSLARSNHTHGHGNRGGGSLHAAATGSVNGFMSAADKAKMDTVVAGARPQISVSMGDSNGPGVNTSSQTPTIIRYAIYRGTGAWTPTSFKIIAQTSNTQLGYCDLYDVTNGNVLATLSFSGNTVQLISGTTFANLPAGEVMLAIRAYRGGSATTVSIYFALMTSN